MSIKRYKIVYEESIKGLEATVSDYIRDGWIPQGGIAIGKEFAFQAMILPESKKNKEGENK